MKTVKKTNRNKKHSVQLVAKQRIDELFNQATKAFKKTPELSNRYIELATKIALKNKTPFSKEQKMLTCKKCLSYLQPGTNSRLRVVKGKIIIRCNKCNNIRRFVYK